jgi:hypothetical protein
MEASEKQIWDEHQERLAKIERDIYSRTEQYKNDKEALATSFSGLNNVPADVRQKLDDNFAKDNKQLQLMQQEEINKVQSDLKKIDGTKMTQAPEKTEFINESDTTIKGKKPDDYLEQNYPKKDVMDDVATLREKWDKERQTEKKKER